MKTYGIVLLLLISNSKLSGQSQSKPCNRSVRANFLMQKLDLLYTDLRDIDIDIDIDGDGLGGFIFNHSKPKLEELTC